jgi:hypothetical protein
LAPIYPELKRKHRGEFFFPSNDRSLRLGESLFVVPIGSGKILGQDKYEVLAELDILDRISEDSGRTAFDGAGSDH